MNITQLAKVQHMLEVISQQENELILETLRKRGPLAFCELHRYTRGSGEEVKARIDSLCAIGIVNSISKGGKIRFMLNPERVEQINNISRRICELRKQALRTAGKR